jgi:hypothetical protein
MSQRAWFSPFWFWEFPPSVLPCSGRNFWIAGHEIGAGNLQIDEGLAFGLILGFDNLPGVVLVASLQAGAFAGFGVNAIKSPIANVTTYQTVTCFHFIFHATAG